MWPEDDLNFWDNVDCANPNQGSILLVLQGGLYFNNDANITYHRLIEPRINHPQFQKCMTLPALHKVYPIFIGFYAQSLQLDKPYPDQSRVNGARFNRQMKMLLRSSGFHMLDVLNFTTDSQTSDGLHK